MKLVPKLLAVSVAAFSLQVHAQTSVEEQIEALQAQIDALKAQVAESKAAADSANMRAEEAAEASEIAIQGIEETNRSFAGLQGTSLGGYGELHYNNLDSGDKIDYHRFVLFLGHQFSDRLRFFSELELEHSLAGEGKPGEVELEQAYIEYDLNANTSAKAGLFLVPVGILNETHEPPTFVGVERNKIESEIIPSTWWEAGAALSGNNGGGFSYDVAVHSGLKVPTSGSSAYKIRSGRQKVAEAVAEDLAMTGRVRYTGIAGLELGLTLQRQSDITQGVEDAGATLVETHADYRAGKFGLRALYAAWDIDSTTAELLGKDEQSGFYLEPSWDVNNALRVFARYGEYNTAEGLPGSEDVEQFDVGANWYLSNEVVIKFDIQNQSGAGNDDGFNLGVGYQF